MFDMAEFLKTNLMNDWFVQSDVEEVLEGIQPKEEVEGEAE